MPLIIGEDKIKSIYVGDNKIKSAYIGDNLAYSAKVKKPSRLPEGYTEVEYIEILSESSTLKPQRSIRSNSNFDGIFEITSKPSASRYILSLVPAASTTYLIYLYSTSSNLIGRCGTTSNVKSSSYSIPTNANFELALSGSSKTLKLYGSSETAVWSNTVKSDYIVLGNNGTSRKALIGARIKYMKATCSTYTPESSDYKYFNWELVPCVHDDGRIGLYDITNNTSFLASATYFSVGPEV